MKTNIVVTTRIEGLHCWKNIDEDHPMQFLKNSHRHLFYITCKWDVTHDDRALEFFMQQKLIKDHFSENYNYNIKANCIDFGKMSCEMIAKKVLKDLECCFVSVFEDGENGAEVFADYLCEY